MESPKYERFFVKVAIMTTPRENSIGGVEHFFQVAESLRRVWPQIVCAGVAMPCTTEPVVRARLDEILNSYPWSIFGEMMPRAQGVGAIFQSACELAFRHSDNEWVIHLPIDLDEHSVELIGNLPKLIQSLGTAPVPGVVIGDYVPGLWRNGRPAPHPIKVALEEHVQEQLRHYFPESVLERRGIRRPRSEFFAIGRTLFEMVCADGRWAPFDPMPGVLLYAERKNIGVERCPLGTFFEADAHPTAISVREQVVRTALQIATEYLRWEHHKDLSPCEVVEKSAMWNQMVAAGMDKAFEAVRRIISALPVADETQEEFL
jgi:hypothetical protein